MVEFDAERSVLVVVGEEHRLTSGLRRRALSAALQAGRDVVVDLKGLSFADSSLMLDLAMLARRLRQRGLELLLRDPQPQVQRLIESMGVHRLPAVAVRA